MIVIGNEPKAFQAFLIIGATETRFGPNRPAADMEGNGEFDF